MNQQKSLIRIAELLARFKFQTIILNSNAQLDINIVSEDILIPILNIAYDCNLKNAKYSENDSRFPALDLLDKEKRIAFQITSTPDIKKARKTLEGIVSNSFYNDFDSFYIYILTQKQNSYDKTVLQTAANGNFTFTEKNILDERDLQQKISSLPYEQILKVENLLEMQFADIKKSENIISSNITGLISSTSLNHEKKYKLLELEGAYKSREAWVKKKIFFEEKLPNISDTKQEYSIIIELETANTNIEEYNIKIINLLNAINNDF